MSIKNEANGLRQKALRLRNEVAEVEAALGLIESTCQHKWSKPVYTPIFHKAYTVPGDPPGTMGIDWRGPCDVPAVTEPQWKRTCSLCGMEQTTKRGDARVIRNEELVPVFPGDSHA